MGESQGKDLESAGKLAKKEGQKNWPYNWKQCEQCRAFTRSHHVGTDGAYPGTQVNNNHSHLNWQLLFLNIAKNVQKN
jgi:ribosomal protein L32